MPSKKVQAARAAAATNNQTTTNNNTKKNGNGKRNKTALPVVVIPTGRVLQDVSKPKAPGHPVPMSAMTYESWAASIAAQAAMPDRPQNMGDAEWFASLSEQQQHIVEFHQEVDSTLDKADDIARSPLDWYFMLLGIYTVEKEGKQVCLLDDLPVPDSDKGNNPAKKKEPGVKKDGTPGMVEHDFYKLFCQDLRPDLYNDHESLKALSPGGNPAKVLPKHTTLTDAQRGSALEKAKKRWARFQTTIKDAIWIRIRFASFKETPAVVADYVYDYEYDKAGNETGKTITSGPAPFVVHEKNNPAKCKTLSVSNFLKLDPEKASKAKNGGTLIEVLATLNRGTVVTPTATVPVMTWERFYNINLEYAAFINDDKNVAVLVQQATNEKLSDDQTVALHAIIMGLDPIYKIIDVRAKRIIADRKEAAAREARTAAETK